MQEHIVGAAQRYQAQLHAIRQNERLSDIGKQRAIVEARAQAEGALAQLDDLGTDIGRKHAALRRRREEAKRAIASRLEPAADRNPLLAQHMARMGSDRDAATRMVSEAVAVLQAGERAPAAKRQSAVDLIQAARLTPSNGLPADLMGEAEQQLRRSLAPQHAEQSENVSMLTEHVRRLGENFS